MKLYLDYKMWRSGGNDPEWKENIKGEGEMMMRNPEGYATAIGQFSVQLARGVNPNVTKDSILCLYAPVQTKQIIPMITEMSISGEHLEHTDLAMAIMKLESCHVVSTDIKLGRLTYLLAQYNIELEVINPPSK